MVSSAALWKVRSAKERALNSPFGEGGEGNSLNNLDLSQWIPNASTVSNSGRMLGKGYIDYQILPDKHLATFYHIFFHSGSGPVSDLAFTLPKSVLDYLNSTVQHTKDNLEDTNQISEPVFW